jgi:hypothetical protein
MFFRICRFGGTILPTRFMVKTYWAMGSAVGKGGIVAAWRGASSAHRLYGITSNREIPD